MPYTKLCRKWHIDRQKEKDREKELIGSVSVINRVFVWRHFIVEIRLSYIYFLNRLLWKHSSTQEMITTNLNMRICLPLSRRLKFQVSLSYLFLISKKLLVILNSIYSGDFWKKIEVWGKFVNITNIIRCAYFQELHTLLVNVSTDQHCTRTVTSQNTL